MVELQNGLLWLAGLMAQDIGEVVIALMVLFGVVEVIARVREWIQGE